MSSYCITVCVQARLSAVDVTILIYSVCDRKSVCRSCQHISLQCVYQKVCLLYIPAYCITVCVTESLSAVHFTIIHYSVCDRKSVCSSCHHTALQCVCQKGCLQFMSPYFITECLPAKLSAVHVTILQYSVCAQKSVCSSCHHSALELCAGKFVCSSCHHTSLQCVCQQGCLQFMSTYCITVCVPARMSAVHVNILHYSVCASKAVCSSCHHIALECVGQQVCLQFMSPHCTTVCGPARLLEVHVTIMHYSVCASKYVCSS